jgi:pyrroloquinoline quinone biosynthesis protein B
MQIEATLELQPKAGVRLSPIAGVILSSADLDHVLGLLLLRELQPLRVFAAASVLQILREDNSFFAMLNRVPRQVEWSAIAPSTRFELVSAAGQSSGIAVTAFRLGTRYPAYVTAARAEQLQAAEAVTGLVVESGGKRLAYLPAVGSIDAALIGRLQDLDLVLFDGTFWSDNELIRVESSGATARQMGHVPVGGSDGALQQLTNLRAKKKIFIHINNTNPMLNESSAECREVRDAGWEIAEDGWQFTL